MNPPQIFITIVLLFALLLAIIQFIKTPKDKRYVIFPENKYTSDPSYSPEYTQKEKITMLFKYGAWMFLFYICFKYYFLPWLKDYASSTHCYSYGLGYISGAHFIWYGAFTLLPLTIALFLFLLEGKRSIKVLKIGQNPLPNEKMFSSTKYKYGIAAKIQPSVILLMILFLICLSVWGSFQAPELIKLSKPCS